MGRAKLKSLEDGEQIELDVVTEERPEFNTDVSDHPIEDGASVSDHVALRPISVPMNGVIAGQGAGDKIATLRRWRNERHRLKFTGRNIFKNYVIQEFSSEHDAGVGDGFRFRLVLQQVQIVKPALVEVTSVDPVGVEPTEADPTPSLPAGKQATTTQVKEEENKGRDTAREVARELTHTPIQDYLDNQVSRWDGHPARGQVR